MKNETNIAKKQTGALAANIFEADANVGSQNIEQDDLALPFIKAINEPFFTLEPSFFLAINFILLSINSNACFVNNNPPITAF